MPNRFGVRHAVLALLLLGLGFSVWLNMLQLDRVWARMGEIKATQGRLEESVVRLEKRVGEMGAGGAGSISPEGASANSTAPAAIGVAWARPGVAIKRTQRPGWIADPTGRGDFASGGVFTEGLELDVEYITPYRGTSAVTKRVLELVQERLADYHPASLELQGVLAEAWQMDPAGMWLRVKLKDNAAWSDGEPVTASDIKFTIELIRNPAYGAKRFQSQFEAVSEVRVLSAKVVEFAFREAIYTNEDGTLRMVPLPAHVYGTLKPEEFIASTGLLVGSGPFKLSASDMKSQWTPGNPVELVRNPRWHGAKRALDGYRFTVTKAPAARLAAIKNGEVDMVRGTPELAAAIGSDPASAQYALVWPAVTAGPVVIVWNCGKRPDGKVSIMSDRRVRTAMTHALDRQKMNKDLFAGKGTVVSGPFLPTAPSCDPGILPLVFSIERANMLLDEAGLKRGEGGKRFDASGNAASIRVIGQREMANADIWSAYVRDQTAALGIACTFDLLDNTAYGSATKARDFDGTIAVWATDSPEPNMHQRYHSSNIAGRGDNDGQWNCPEADTLIEEARRTLDPATRAVVWRALHGVIHREQPATFIVSRPMIILASNRVGNVTAYPMGLERTEFYVKKPAPK